ncbi:hypothetical protein FPSE_08985 [Fusarium pseudograminearum CS3096]|uniref:Xylanolytic transcriptional activator regulatory domain-containing protein n=1 Tax=Fusarium pseudograminearum (strain CS3096) TaxID=1028729 RepID=K3VE48_FUSPC|nr:hypothetical protein FPSE_08985 [Fusarium pseudograminearum CS3096]EKJ70833.1 hypothetical protein FPSE_08985 [Fusarium pseudograminearum CS3096]
MDDHIDLTFDRHVFPVGSANPAASPRNQAKLVLCAGPIALSSSTPKSRQRAKRDSRASLARAPHDSGTVPGRPVSVLNDSAIEQSTISIAPDPMPTSTRGSIRDTTTRNTAPVISPLASRSTEWPQQDAQPEESPLALGSNDEQQHNLHIVGPTVTSDNQVLSDYLSAMPSSTRGSRIVRPVPGNISRPVLFTMVQKRPVGLDSNRTFPEERLQLIEKILEPFASDVLDVSPGLSVIEAAILNIGGREVTSLIGNGVLFASSIAMAHSLGLNHSPTPWEIPQSEKNLRMRIWWALLIHDKWLSLAHGTPPIISTSLNDVPKPLAENLCEEGASSDRMLKATVYIALVGLTDVLDLHLRHVHRLRNADEPRATTHLELALNSWVEDLGDDIRRVVIRGTNLAIPGAANLRLSYLTVRLLSQRIELEAEKRIREASDSRLLNRYMQARRTAEDILILVQELQAENLADFWLPSSAFALSTTVSFLLRCALETENSTSGLVQSSSLKIASDLLSTLRSHKEKHAWDLGDICLAQHTEVVEKLLAITPPEDPSAEEPQDFSSFFMPDDSFLDQLFPSLWDPLQNVW